MTRRLHLLVSGRVQGVCYRLYCQDQATALGLAGWVRNLPDGRVEVLAEGDESPLRKLLAWCGRGPGMAVVREVVEEWGDAEGMPAVFEVRS